MPTNKELDDARREAETSPTAWFVVLERARQANDFELAAEAQRQLKKLGITVTYRRAATEVACASK